MLGAMRCAYCTLQVLPREKFAEPTIGRMRIALVTLLLTLSAGAPAEGWRFPTEEDMTGDWKFFQGDLPKPYVVRADFDGTGVEDEAWLVINTSGSGWKLIALMNGEKTAITLVAAEDGDPQYFGIEQVPPGEHKTACGKGYWECSASEPAAVTLKYPGFRFFKFESASTLWFWDESQRRLREIAESD